MEAFRRLRDPPKEGMAATLNEEITINQRRA